MKKMLKKNFKNFELEFGKISEILKILLVKKKIKIWKQFLEQFLCWVLRKFLKNFEVW